MADPGQPCGVDGSEKSALWRKTRPGGWTQRQRPVPAAGCAPPKEVARDRKTRLRSGRARRDVVGRREATVASRVAAGAKIRTAISPRLPRAASGRHSELSAPAVSKQCFAGCEHCMPSSQRANFSILALLRPRPARFSPRIELYGFAADPREPGVRSGVMPKNTRADPRQTQCESPHDASKASTQGLGLFGLGIRGGDGWFSADELSSARTAPTTGLHSRFSRPTRDLERRRGRARGLEAVKRLPASGRITRDTTAPSVLDPTGQR